MSFWDKILGTSVEVLRQDKPVTLDTDALKAQLMETNPSYRKSMQTIERQDKQILAIKKAEIEYTNDITKLIKFWENLLDTDGLLFNSAQWPFRIIELYYKAHRYDDAWRALTPMTLNPLLTRKVRQWQIKILKKEKKDYSHVQALLDNHQ